MTDIIAYENLANAVVLQAVEDYRDLLKRLTIFPNDPATLRELRDLEQDIHTPFFQSLTKLDIDKLFDDVKAQFLKEHESQQNNWDDTDINKSDRPVE
ncbi:MAG: hypothetical protein ACI4WS_09275 [Oscillospiraceae bacterium]